MKRTHEQLERFLTRMPQFDQTVFVAPGAVVIGDVKIGGHSSVWYNAVIRGDINRIEIGTHSNIQDTAVLHVADDFPCLVGNFVTIGHGAIVHACTVGNECLIGMGATVLDGAVIGDQSLIGAGALVTQGVKIPEGSLVLGSPARVARPLSAAERQSLKSWADKYVDNAAWQLAGKPVGRKA